MGQHCANSLRRMMGWLLPALLWGLVQGVAYGSDPPPPTQGSPRTLQEEVEATFPRPPETRASVAMHITLESPTGQAMRLVYGEKLIHYGLAGTYKLDERLSVGLSVAFGKEEGVTVGQVSHLPGEETTQIFLLPVQLEAIYRPLHLSPWFEPFGAAGLDFCYYRETAEAETPLTWEGLKLGVHARVGLGIRIDGGPPQAWSIDARHGDRAVRLELSAGYAMRNSFTPSGLSLSGFNLTVGLSKDF